MTIEIVAHRANDEATLRRYLAAGPDAIEIDVVGVVVAHELDGSDASGLLIDDVLRIVGDVPLIVEAKSPDGAAALEPYLDRVRVISFHEQVLREVAGRAPTTILFSDRAPLDTVADTLGPREDLVTADLMRAVDRPVVPWTVNDGARMRELIELGVAGLTTDDPALAMRVACTTP